MIEEFAAALLSSEEAGSGKTVVDSGATHVLSRERTDFAQINGSPSVSINAANGRIAEQGYLGIFRRNNLKIELAVYFPHLPVRRLISTNVLNELLWECNLHPTGSHLYSLISGERVVVEKEGKLPVVDIVFENDNTNCSEAQALLGVTKLLKHRRMAHLYLKGLKVDCPDCNIAKGGKKSPADVRPEEHSLGGPLRQLNTDFWGPVTPESIRRAKYFIVFVDDAINHVWMKPIRYRSDCVAAFEELIKSLEAEESSKKEEKLVFVIRSDNDTCFRSAEWLSLCRKL